MRGLVVWAVLALCVLLARGSHAQLCTTPPPLQQGDVVNVAVLQYIAGAPQGLFTGNLLDAPPAPGPIGLAQTFFQPAQIGHTRVHTSHAHQAAAEREEECAC